MGDLIDFEKFKKEKQKKKVEEEVLDHRIDAMRYLAFYGVDGRRLEIHDDEDYV